jgi:hypothetical protein
LVGTEHGDTVAGQDAQRCLTRVSVRVSRADADQGDPCVHRVEKLRRGVPAAVVRDLDDVGPEVDVGGEQIRLCGEFDVAGEQHPAGSRRCLQHH